MSQKPKPAAKTKKNEKREEKREGSLEEPVDEEAQPWKNIFRPTCAQPPKDNNFTLDDEGAAAAAEGFLSSFTVSDPNEEGNPLCYVSPGFLSMTGYSEQDCLGRNCKFLQNGKDDPGTQETLHNGLSERRVTTVELTNYRKDGRAFQNLLTVAPVMGGPDGSNLLQFVGVQCDLEERRRRGDPVDDAFLGRWQELVKHCLTSFALVDVSGGGPSFASSSGPAGGGGGGSGSRGSTAAAPTSPPPAAAVCAVSPGFTTLTGYGQSDVMGWNLLCLCGPDSQEREMRKLLTSQWSHTPTAVKLLCYKRDGTPFWALVLSFPLTRTTPAPAPAAGAPAGAGAAATAGASGTMGLVTGVPAPQPTSGAGAGRLAAGAPASARAAQAQGGGVAGRGGGLSLGILGGVLLGGVAGVSGSGLGLLGGLSAGAAGLAHGAVGAGAAGGVGAAAPQTTIKYCLCCVVDITAQRLKKVVGGKYVLGKVIGAGAFGLVRIGKNTATDELVAVKGVDATRFRNINELDQIQEEMSVLASLKHPNIIRLFDVHFQSNTFFLVMEFAGNGSLVHFMKHHGDPVKRCLDEATAARVFVQMVGALDYCHRRRVVHRDLKPENILMDEHNNLKIADFGLAAVAAPFSGGLTLQCGTPEFTAPEITTGREYDGTSVDIWSMGVILYEALCGSLPFNGTNQNALFKAIQKGVYDPLPSAISHDCKDLVKRMLTVDPSNRIRMEEILRHPWLTKAAAAAGATGSGRPAGGSYGEAGAASLMYEPATNGAAAGDEPRFSGNGGSGGGPCLNPPSSSNALAGEDESSRSSGAWRGGPGGGGPGGSGPRSGAPPHVSDGVGVLGPSQHPGGASRPSSAGFSLAGGGPSPPGSSPTAVPIGLPPGAEDGPVGGPGALHDSVKLVIPSQADRDDPILAAILRGHGHVHPEPAPARPDDGDDGDAAQGPPLGSVPAYAVASLSSGGRREGAGVSARVGPSNRSVGGGPLGSGGGLHGGQGVGNGKARGGALLPTLGGGGGNAPTTLDRPARASWELTGPTRMPRLPPPGLSGAYPASARDVGDMRRLPDATRFRSPARTGQGGAGGRGGPGNVVVPAGARAAQAGAPASPGQSPHGGHAYLAADGAGRQLPPIQNNRALGKKSSWMPGL